MRADCRTLLVLCLALAFPAHAAHEPWTTHRLPQDVDKWWWDAEWWERGTMPVPLNHEVRSRSAAYRSGDT
jgi:hypothetical protein